ncbi:MAG: DNA alkylation repair protein [Acidobacteria bacterium]|nr:DNA alkylation repair protein [Acidobacteriota bacterium]
MNRRVSAMLAQIEAFLASHVDPVFAAGQQGFFRDSVPTCGVRTVHVNELVRLVYREVKKWEVADRDQLMEALWKTRKLEPGVVVCHVYRRFGKSFGAREFDLFESWLERYVTNWAHSDGLSSWLLAACIGNQPELRHRLPPWTKSGNRWKRRAAAVSLLHEAKRGRHLEDVLAMAARLLKDRDDMVEKGVGWLLKEAYPARPREVVEFLSRHGREATRLTLRYAAEKMTPADRARVLG